MWTSPFTIATADEGALSSGSRGFTEWFAIGLPFFHPGNSLEHLVARLGHYPEDRSDRRGNQPEVLEFGRYGDDRFLFVGSDRSGVIVVYRVFGGRLFGNSRPFLCQVLPAGVRPEGLLAIPERDLFVAANQVDDRGRRIRSSIMIYERSAQSTYPEVVSENRAGSDVPIPWGALSGLATDREDPETLYSIHDSIYRESRIFELDRSSSPVRIIDEHLIVDSQDLLLDRLNELKAQLPGTDDFEPTAIVNADQTVNLDPEGIAVGFGGNRFWLASEGAGNLVDGVSDPVSSPFTRPNMLVEFIASPPFVGKPRISRVLFLPLELTRNQSLFGFEGVAARGDERTGRVEELYVAFQRAWQVSGDPPGMARIGRYEFSTDEWTFVYYPFELPTSPNGGWVGLSGLTHVAGDEFAALERDNQGGPDASVKRVYSFSIDGLNFADNALAPNFDVVTKACAADLIAEGSYDFAGGLPPQKIEGLAVLPDGTALVVNDNDGVDDNDGETRLLEFSGLFD